MIRFGHAPCRGTETGAFRERAARTLMVAFSYLSAFLVLVVACTSPAPPPASPTAAAPKQAAATPTSAAPKEVAATPTAPAKAQAPLAKFTFGRPSGAPGGAYLTALARGYWTELGLDVELVDFDSAARMVPALASGQLDAGVGQPTAGLFNAIKRDIPMRIVADSSSSPPGNLNAAIVVRKDLWDGGLFRSISDLKGRTYAMPALASGTHYQAYLLAKMGGLTLADLNLVEMAFPDMMPAFGNKSIDVARQNEPQIASGIERGLFVRWKGSAEIYPDFTEAIILFSPQLMTTKADVAKRWMVGYLKGARTYNDALRKGTDREQIISYLMKWSSIKERPVFDKMEWQAVNPDGYANMKVLTDELDWFIEMGFVKEKMSIGEAIDNQYVDNAIQQLGKYQ